MEVQTREVEKGTEIQVFTDQKVALSVRTGDEEIIYLPQGETESSTYYTSSTNGLARTEKGYKVVHGGKIENIEVIH